MARSPLIGITTSFDRGDVEPFVPGRRLLLVDPAYAEALEPTGAAVTLLPFSADENPAVLEYLSGLLVTGNDRPLIHQLVDQIDTISLRDLNPERYDSDVFWIKRALERQMPILGVCRGMQTINEVLGGTVRRLGLLPNGSTHAQPTTADQTWHELTVDADSLLGRTLGESYTRVNSFHLQGVKVPGSGVRFTAFAPGGAVEALEVSDRPFCLGLQFHPEKLLKTSPVMGKIFRAFAEAARAYASGA